MFYAYDFQRTHSLSHTLGDYAFLNCIYNGQKTIFVSIPAAIVDWTKVNGRRRFSVDFHQSYRSRDGIAYSIAYHTHNNDNI